MNIGPGPSWGETWRRRGGSVGGGRDPTTKCRCVLPLRPLRACSASGRTARLPGPLKALPPPPMVAAEARDAARGGGTRPREIRTPDKRKNWWIPFGSAPNRERGDCALSPLRCERGIGAVHAGLLSGVDAAVPRPYCGNRMGSLAAGDPRDNIGERDREEGRDLLLWAGYASEGGSGTPTPRGSAGEGSAEAVNALRRGALGPPRSPVGSNLGAGRSAPRDRQAVR